MPPRPSLEEFATDELDGIRAAGLHRILRRIEGAQGPEVSLDGRRILLLCSNNYLGLADHPEVVQAAAEATRSLGASAVSSRLISGHMGAHAELEERIAAWKGTEAALTFSTGYQANTGVIPTLVGKGDVVVSDELNHASIIDGCRLSRARVAVYRHNDVADLRTVLTREAAEARRILVVTESVFSMDGAGLAAELGLTEHIDVHLGTLGKAIGSFGAYVAGSRRLVELLVNRARPFIFTTGLPPACAAATMAALDVIEREPQRAAALLARARDLGARLRAEGFDVPEVQSQILPVLVGAADDAVALARALLERDVYVAAIRPPTVPRGTSRLRLSLMATHTDAHIDRAIAAFVAARSALGGEGCAATASAP
jgi:7-keto-8-aminopelargonate synthetase-like enzyme